MNNRGDPFLDDLGTLVQPSSLDHHFEASLNLGEASSRLIPGNKFLSQAWSLFLNLPDVLENLDRSDEVSNRNGAR